MNDTTTIRINREVYNTVKSLARQRNNNIQGVVEEAVKHYKKKLFFDSLDEAYTRLKSDPDAWAAEEPEREEWDAFLQDGLEND